MRRPLDLTLTLVTDVALCGPRGVPAVVRAAVAGGVTAVQVRAKDASDRERLALVDDAVDVALLAGADGVHLGQSDLPVPEVRALGGPDLLIGLSVSSVEEVRAAAGVAVDYLGVGPVWATSTKPLAAPPLGPAGTAEVVAAAGVPCVAIGGVGAATVGQLRGRGLAGFCVVSALCAADDPEAAARDLRARWSPGPGSA